MNPELQKSLQVASLSNVVDSYLLVILLIMVAAGMLGGGANYFLSERQRDGAPREWLRFAVLGVVAALTVPLFLNMISSNLIEAARTRPVDFFVFGGFCLIYVVASRRIVENVANRFLLQIDQLKREMAQLKRPVPSAESGQAGETPPASRPESGKEALAYNDVEILRALAEENYVYGNLAGFTEKTGLAREQVSARLIVLKNLGFIETRINDKNVLHWHVSARGTQMLDEILSGQRDR